MAKKEGKKNLKEIPVKSLNQEIASARMAYVNV